MNKYKAIWLVLIPLALLLLAQPVLAVAPGYYDNPHYVISSRNDLCSTCHQMNGAGGTANPTAFISTTIFGTCFTCHNGTKANYNVSTSMDNATGTPGFTASYSIHKVKSETILQPVLDTTFGSMKLTCVSCHSAHGNTNFRYLKTTLPTGATNLNVYASVTKPVDYATGKDQIVYGTGMDNWCGGCHDQSLHANGANGINRHQVDYPLGPTTLAIYNAYNYVPGATDWHAAQKVPVGVGVVMDGGGNVTGMGNQQRVMCLSCHQGHGSNSDKNLLRDKRGRICLQCHMNGNQEIK